MYKSKEQRQKIIDTNGFGGKFFLKQVGNGCENDGARNQKLHPFAADRYNLFYTKK